MIEKIGPNEVIVNDYTSNFNIKEMIHEHLIPKAFPNIPMNKLNIGFNGLISEYISTVIEDTYSTSVLMLNESFINKAMLPNSIYSEASIYDIGYSFATPSRCDFALQLSLDDVIKYSEPVINTSIYRYIIDKDTRIILGESSYRLDYDIIIDHTMQNGKRIFKIYYDDKEINSISSIKNQYIKYQTTTINWLVLFLNLKEFDRRVDEVSLTDNLITTNSDIELVWTDQIAGIDLVYIDPLGNRFPMKLKVENSKYDVEPFVWYRFTDNDTMLLKFSSNERYWTPDFNSKIEYTIYTCNGSKSNFDSYNNRAGVPVEKFAEKYSYNASTRMVALCYGGSVGGLDKGDLEDLRNDVILAKNTCDSLSTTKDIELWFQKYANKYGSKSNFFKRRDDPSGQLFSQFINIVDNSYTYPTNTLSMKIYENEADNKKDYMIINAGNIWNYAENENYIIPLRHEDQNISIMDNPKLNNNETFNFINPFIIKIFKDPFIMVTYNYLINHTSWPNDIPININYFYQFQLATLHIERSFSNTKKNAYHIELICVPSVLDEKIKYIEGIGDEFDKSNNKLRLVLIIQTKQDGEIGYVEMIPKEIREAGSIVFETDLFVKDNILDNDTVEIDLSKTKGMKSLLSNQKVFMDIDEPRLHFITLYKDATKSSSPLFNDPTFNDYIYTNRFVNNYQGLQLYKPMNMMRYNITKDEDSKGKYIMADMVPFIGSELALNDDRMKHFIQTFTNQYQAMEPVLRKIEGNAFIDFKFYNTYGRSLNYFIGPEDNVPNLKDSKLHLDNVYVKIKLKMAVHNRELFTQTANDVKKEIISFFDRLNDNNTDVHVSNILRSIEVNHQNVRYIRFLGFNNYDSRKQSIFIKDLQLSKNELSNKVPELLIVDEFSIDITEESDFKEF